MSQKRHDRVEFLKPDGQEPFGLHDLSQSGAAFLYPHGLNEGSVIQVQVGEIQLSAKVIYSREQVSGYKSGVQFESVSEQNKTKLESLVEKFSRGMPIDFGIQK